LAKKKQTVIKVKEIQLRPQTEEHDLEYKFKSVRQFLEDGDKAKITITFKGREIAFMDEHGFKIMKQLIELVKDVGSVESPPKVEGKKMIMVLAPGVSKKPATGTVQIPAPVGSKGPTIKPVITPVQPNKPGNKA
jgi:translation initiation factor IF-3